MADRVSATIRIGGTLAADLLDDFERVVQAESLSIEWDGETFTRADLVEGERLYLVAHEVAWGEFEALQVFCRDHHLPYVRWCDGSSGGWDPQRLVWSGTGEPVTYAATSDDGIVIDCETVERLGTLDAVRAHFAAADFAVPPFRVASNPA